MWWQAHWPPRYARMSHVGFFASRMSVVGQAAQGFAAGPKLSATPKPTSASWAVWWYSRTPEAWPKGLGSTGQTTQPGFDSGHVAVPASPSLKKATWSHFSSEQPGGFVASAADAFVRPGASVAAASKHSYDVRIGETQEGTSE